MFQNPHLMSWTSSNGSVEGRQSIAVQIVIQTRKEHVVFSQMFFVKFRNISVGLDCALSSEKQKYISSMALNFWANFSIATRKHKIIQVVERKWPFSINTVISQDLSIVKHDILDKKDDFILNIIFTTIKATYQHRPLLCLTKMVILLVIVG